MRLDSRTSGELLGSAAVRSRMRFFLGVAMVRFLFLSGRFLRRGWKV